MRTSTTALRRLSRLLAGGLVGLLFASPSAATVPAGGATVRGASATTAVVSAAPAAAGQLRGYWVDAFNPGIYTSAQIDALIADAKTVRANALIVQTSRRFDCFCNDALFPRTGAAISALPFDPLETLVQRAHTAGLEVHAWVNATTLWNSATAPAAVDHAYNVHGPSASGANRWLNKRVDGVEIVSNNSYLDPANPAAVDYLVEGVTSITSAYDVDGVTLDYIRYPDYSSGSANDWGYSTTSLARFRAETGRTDTPAVGDAQFSQWRRDQVTALVRKVYLAMYQEDPTDRLSVSGITYGYGPQTTGGWESTSAYRSVLQDWRGWIEEGIVDTVATMNYKREYLADQAKMFTEWTQATLEYQGDRQNVVGPALYLNDLAGNVAQAKAVRAAGLGWVGYSYANASRTATASTSATTKRTERDLLQSALRDSLFPEPAAVPDMTWKTAPTTGHLTGTVRNADRALDQVALTVRAAGIESADVRNVRTDGSGWFGVLDLAPGKYVVAVTEPGLVACDVTVDVSAGGVTNVEPALGPCATPVPTVPPGTPEVNVARSGGVVVSASSENLATGQAAVKVVDGSVLGYPADHTREWATVGGKAGSWVQLTWGAPVTVNRVVLHDRPNLIDQVMGAQLVFSDGSRVETGSLNNSGSTAVSFSARTVTSLRVEVTSVSSGTVNIGLAELEAWGYQTP